MHEQPVAVSATGAGHVPGEPGKHRVSSRCSTTATLIAQFNVNWLAPVKVRHTLIGGSRKMIVYDDLEPSEKIKVYDRGSLDAQSGGGATSCGRLSNRRHVGAATLDATEALLTRDRALRRLHRVTATQPTTGAASGLGVVAMLEARHAVVACSAAAQSISSRCGVAS